MSTEETAAATEASVPPEEPAAEEAVAEEESTAVFQPVVNLQEVEVVTGEEEEELLWSHKSKVYVYGETLLNKGSGINSWNERGVGDVKFLKNKQSGVIRVLMRQMRTEKLLVNHKADPWITIKPQAGTDRAYCYNAMDFSNEELVLTNFALKFKDAEIADTFKNEFVKAQEAMRALGTTSEDQATAAGESTAADDVADALAGLSTSEGAAEEAKES